MPVDYGRINNTLGKFQVYFASHNSISISVSGGSDSDIIVHIVATYMREFLPKIHFLNVNTGLEYQATKDHLKYLEQRYNIQIERLRGVSVVTSVRRYGVPILSKQHSHLINSYLKGQPYALLIFEHPEMSKNVSMVKKCSPAFRRLVEEIRVRNIMVSDKCCEISKKKPLIKRQKELKVDLVVTGERKAEGGIRAVSHSSCFEEDNHGMDKYMPLFFWDDETKAYYKETEGIRYSDCYEVWGMKRTGCVGCPYNSKIAQELRVIEKYEPRLAEACKNVFGESYRLIDELWCRKDKVFPKETQLSLFDNTEAK